MPSRQMLIFGGAFLAVVALAFFWFWPSHSVTTDDAQIEARVVTISAKVSGHLVVLHVGDNQRVAAGDILAEIDPRDYEIRVAKAKAQEAALDAQRGAARAALAAAQITAPANAAQAVAQVAAAQATLDQARQELNRLQGTRIGIVTTRRALDAAIAAERNARASLAAAQARLTSAGTTAQTLAVASADVARLDANVQATQADVAQAENDLAKTRILAPFAGHVARRAAEQGAFIQAGQALMAIVSDERWVVANFKETQLTRMRPGQSVQITIDAFPDLKLTGKVDSIQHGTGARFSLFPPENATGNFVKIVQRVPVKIVFDKPLDPELPIAAGMSVSPEVTTR